MDKALRTRYLIAIGILFVVVLIVAIAVPVSLRNSASHSEKPYPKVVTARTAAATQRNDCYPEAKGDKTRVNQAVCKSRGCVFDTAQTPPCFRMAMKGSSTFTFEQTFSMFDFEGVLTSTSGEANEVNEWVFKVDLLNDDLVRFSVKSSNEDRYEVPKPLFPRTGLSKPKYDFRVTNADPFRFKIIRNDTGTVIWDLETSVNENGLILTDQLLQISTRLPSTNVYGLGEHKHNSFKHVMNATWPSFARDQPPTYEEEANLYGVHPFYTCVEDSAGNTHGVLLYNSNAQEYAFSTKPSLTFRTIGGILDFYVFLGPTPEDVIQQYTELIGRPYMPPYWALGFQLSRYGYNNIQNLKDAVDSTRKYNIPQDVQYVDIDHMDARKDFTIDQKRFPDLNDYFKSLQADGMRIIYLLDPCLMASEAYEPYRLIKAADGAIKWASDIEQVPDNVNDTGALLGFVWPKDPVVFVDFLKDSVRSVWTKLIRDHRENLTFDGLWIDMNEPASFGTNLDMPWNWPATRKPVWSLHCPNNSLEDPPYRPKAAYRWDEAGRRARLSDKTICMSTVHGNLGQFRHYDVHSVYGMFQTARTIQAARNATGERSVVISRSTFPGSGYYGGHWLGDNASEWPDLHSSIIGMLEFNLFGIPYVGADICGFNNNATSSLCLRWMQLGAFYPFCRNHNAINSIKQAPGQMGDELGRAAAEIIRIRYRLLPYLYTLFFVAHTTGSTVVRPLHHLDPTDAVALTIDKQFMWGYCLLISPILEENQKTLHFYLPKGRWYNYFTHEKTQSPSGQWRSINVEKDSKPELFVREECVLVEQEPANNTHHSRKNPIRLLVTLDQQGNASGAIFWDDGVSIHTYKKENYFAANIVVKDSKLKFEIVHQVQGDPAWQKLSLDQIVVLGIPKAVTKVELNGSTQNVVFVQNSTIAETTITLQNVTVTDPIVLSWT